MDAPDPLDLTRDQDVARPGSDADRNAVAAIVARSDERQRRETEETAHRDATRKRNALLTRGSGLATLCATLMGVVALDVYLLSQPTAPPTAEQVESMARMETALVALTVEAFAQSTGRYPTSLDEAGIDLIGVEYTPTSDGFVVTATGSPTTVSLRADQDPEELTRAMPGGMR